MSHLDELDEFEAEAELRLKKEYSAVFSLFRYCVLTQDATYLCNKLDMQYVPQPNYPFFQLQMEDVWVWDKNRPTRMIPRAEVYTSSDVTIEELRGEGDEPVLTAEALAKRIGEGRQRDRRPLAVDLARAMLLAIDVGNTQTVFGLFDGERLTEQFRVGTDRCAHGRRARRACCARSSTSSALDGIVLCSSVPQLVREYEAFAERWAGAELLVLGPGVSTGMPIRYDDPREVGPDRIANAVAARERHGAPAVVVDFGTSTNFDVVSAAGEFAGGVLAPGIEISMDALFARAARLPKVPFVAPERVISQTTTAALQSGLVYGFAGQVDAIVDRIRDELGAPEAHRSSRPAASPT